jgi:hypothetical protein
VTLQTELQAAADSAMANSVRTAATATAMTWGSSAADVRPERAAGRAVSRERQRHAWGRDCAPRCVAAAEQRETTLT